MLSHCKSLYAFIFLILTHLYSSQVQAVDFINVGPEFKNLEKIGQFDLANITSFTQDKLGFIWLVNHEGVLRFDGNEIKTFPALEPLKDINLGYIVEGQQGRLWISTSEKGKGLALFDTRLEQLSFVNIREKFGINLATDSEKSPNLEITYKNKQLYLVRGHKLYVIDEASLTLQQTISLPISAGDIVIRLTVTENGDVWYSTQQGKGVSRIDKKGIHAYVHQPTDSTTISADLVFNIFEDSKGRIWFSTFAGLDLFQPNSESFKHYAPIELAAEENKKYGVRANVLLNIVEDERGHLWLALINSGIVRFQPENESFEHYPHINGISSTISTDRLYWGGVFIDRQETLWISTVKGLNQLTKNSREIKLWANIDKDNCTPLRAQKTKGAVTFACGKDIFQLKDDTVSYITSIEHTVYSIYHDVDNIVWLGTTGGGVYQINLKTKLTKQYNLTLNGELATNTIERIGSDVLGELYGIVQKHPNENGSGIIHYDTVKDEFSNLATNIQLAELVDVDDSRMLLVGSYSTALKQLYWFDKKSQAIEQLPIKTGVVYAALKWKKQLWLSTQKLGLMSIDINTGQWRQLAKNTTDKVSALYLNHDEDKLFLNINKHVYKLVSINKGKINIDCTTCSIAPNLSQMSHPDFGQIRYSYGFLIANDKFLVRAENKLITFPVSSSSRVTTNNLLLLTDYKVMGKSVIPEFENDNALLNESIEQSKRIVIPPETTFFSFSFARVGAAQPEQVKYAYKMEGLNKDWVHTDINRPEATFSLLSAGNYTFKVKASDDKGDWHKYEQPLTLEIVVLSPWWQTWWAYSLYLCLVFLLFWLFYRAKLIENERRSVVKLAHAKEQLFANISHEFRTPLTLILGPAKIIQANSDDEQIQQNISLIERNAHRLLSMVEQLLHLAQLRKPRKESDTAQQVSTICQFILQSFDVIAQEKQISLHLDSVIDDSWWVSGEKNALETILYNLLTNAIKFTQVGGVIRLEVTEQGQNLKFNVTDSGCGIASHQQTKIFERFTRLENNNGYVPGAGIGLAIVQELVKILGGKITVNSQLNEGASFIFTLPKVKANVGLINDEVRDITKSVASSPSSNDGQIESHSTRELLPETVNELADQNSDKEFILNLAENDNKYTEATKPMVLVVDDNEEVRIFLKQILFDNYLIINAEDGQQALALTRAYCPDIIISDVMMPKMDGFELLATIRNDMAISHIPVVLLTAKGDQQSKLKGFSDLADDYITKPFDAQDLLMRIERLLAIRTLLQKRLNNMNLDPVVAKAPMDTKKEVKTKYTIDDFPKKDQQFLIQFKELIEQGHQDPELTLTMISIQLAMSDRQLQRKLKAIIGISFSEILREHRLTQGCLLLDNGEQIAVIADQVGFGSSSYFVRCFKAKYGKTPNEYRKTN